MKLKSINPATGKTAAVIKESSTKEIKNKIKIANYAKDMWGNLTIKERIQNVKSLFVLLKKHEKEIAKIISEEIGTPISESMDEVVWNWSYIEWFLDNVTKAISPNILFENSKELHQIVYEPIGAAAVITPWNLPCDMFVWGVIPNLLVGNTIVYKAAEECIATGKLLENIASKAELPKGVLNFVHGGAKVGETLINENIDLIWFTGSTEVGHKLYELAGKKFIKAVMELGGSNPAIVFEDADIEKAVKSIFTKRFMFCGQTCDADKRILVHVNIQEEFVNKFLEKVNKIKLGLPSSKDTEMGPLVSRKQLKLLKDQVNDAIAKGAIALTGNKKTGLTGEYFLPTVLTNVTRDMKVWNEEVFGPVVPIIAFKSDDEAVMLANDTKYGLGAQIFTRDNKKALNIALKIKSGNVDVNGIGHFKPYIPFGGYKNSGIGREHGLEGFRELCQIKTISINK